MLAEGNFSVSYLNQVNISFSCPQWSGGWVILGPGVSVLDGMVVSGWCGGRLSFLKSGTAKPC